MSIFRSRVGAVAVGAALVVGLGSATAVAGDLIGTGDIKDDSVRSVDIKDGTIRQHDLTEPAQAAFKGKPGKPGKPGKDGKDGVSGIAAGAGYADLGHHAKWEAGSWGQTVQKCKAGEYAVGGGFSSWGGFNGDNSKDLGGAADVQITVSAPYIENDAAYEPISDTDSRFRPTLWVVRGFNHGSEPVDVRAWVVCAADPSAN